MYGKGAAMEDLFIAGILLVFVGAAVLFLWKERKKGAGSGCIGCPSAGHCPGRASDQTKKDCSCMNKKHINNKTK